MAQDGKEGQRKRNLPMEVPLSDDATHSHPPNSHYNAPCQTPNDRDERNQPPCSGRDLIDVRVLPRMAPVADHGEAHEERQERDRREGKDGE